MLEGENDREREAESPQATGPESDADKNCILEPGLLVPGLGLLWWAVPYVSGAAQGLLVGSSWVLWGRADKGLLALQPHFFLVHEVIPNPHQPYICPSSGDSQALGT